MSQPSSPRARTRGSQIGAVVQTGSIVVLFLVTMGSLVLGFVTSAGMLLHLPSALVAAADAVGVALLLWLGWMVGRTAWSVERELARDALTGHHPAEGARAEGARAEPEAPVGPEPA